MGRITDRLFWTEEGQAKTDERFRQARDPQSIEGQWRRVCTSTCLPLFSGVLIILAVLLDGRRWTDFRIGSLAFWSVCLVLTLLDFGRQYRRKRRGDWRPRLRPPAQTGTKRVLRYFGLR